MTTAELVGKVVVLTANGTVGLGSENDVIKGVVVTEPSKMEAGGVYIHGYEGVEDTNTFKLDATTATACGLTGDYQVAVKRGVTVEDVAISATDSKQPSFGDFVLADGAGGVVLVPSSSTAYPTAYADSVDTTNKLAVITIL